MAKAGSAITDLAHQAAACRACDLWARATPVVFGDGPAPARLLIHPAAVLRARDEDERRNLFDGLVADLARARALAS